MGSYFKCLGKYATFRGRSARREFWGYSIVNLIIILVILLLHAKFQFGVSHTVMTYILILYIAVTICPTLAVMSRRWHDLGRTGAWLLLNLVPGIGSFVSLCFFLYKGDEGTNRYGRDPRERKYKRKR